MSRIEAAAKALYQHNATENEGGPIAGYPADEFECCAAEAIKAADRHDAANGVHRIAIDDATVERAARAMHNSMVSLDGPAFEEAPARTKEHFRLIARVVLAVVLKGYGE